MYVRKFSTVAKLGLSNLPGLAKEIAKQQSDLTAVKNYSRNTDVEDPTSVDVCRVPWITSTLWLTPAWSMICLASCMCVSSGSMLYNLPPEGSCCAMRIAE
jgi:hypothetical protein